MKALAFVFALMTAVSGGMFKAVQPDPIKLPQFKVVISKRAARRKAKRKGKKKFGY